MNNIAPQVRVYQFSMRARINYHARADNHELRVMNVNVKYVCDCGLHLVTPAVSKCNIFRLLACLLVIICAFTSLCAVLTEAVEMRLLNPRAKCKSHTQNKSEKDTNRDFQLTRARAPFVFAPCPIVSVWFWDHVIDLQAAARWERVQVVGIIAPQRRKAKCDYNDATVHLSTFVSQSHTHTQRWTTHTKKKLN